MNTERHVILHDEEGGYWVECPSLPGCFSQGDTRAEALANIKESIEAYLESLQKHHNPIPEENGLGDLTPSIDANW